MALPKEIRFRALLAEGKEGEFPLKNYSNIIYDFTRTRYNVF